MEGYRTDAVLLSSMEISLLDCSKMEGLMGKVRYITRIP
jgi:hypothetical protein